MAHSFSLAMAVEEVRVAKKSKPIELNVEQSGLVFNMQQGQCQWIAVTLQNIAYSLALTQSIQL